MNNRPTIGIIGYKGSDNNSFGVGIAYLEWINKFGNPRIIMPWEEYVEVDLLVLPGGLDLNPSSYGAIPEFRTSNTDVFKQFFYDHRLKNYIGQVPIWGMCLGSQQLASYFGSKLCQDLFYHEYQSNPRSELVHGTYVFDDNIKIIKDKDNKPVNIKVNSLHHQGIYSDELGQDLQMILGHKEGKRYIVEVFKHKQLPIIGYQGHLEETYEEFGMNLMQELLNYKYEPVPNK